MTSLLAALFQPWQISCKTFQQLFTFVLELRVEKTLENLSKLLLFPEKGIESTIALEMEQLFQVCLLEEKHNTCDYCCFNNNYTHKMENHQPQNKSSICTLWLLLWLTMRQKCLPALLKSTIWLASYIASCFTDNNTGWTKNIDPVLCMNFPYSIWPFLLFHPVVDKKNGKKTCENCFKGVKTRIRVKLRLPCNQSLILWRKFKKLWWNRSKKKAKPGVVKISEGSH